MSGRLHERSEPVHFSPEALANLKKHVKERTQCETMSTNEALSAHLTRLCMLLYQHPKSAQLGQVTVINMRERIDSIPDNFVGNASFGLKSAEFQAGISLDELARMIHEGLRPYLKPPCPELLENVQLTMELAKHRAIMAPFDFSGMHTRKPTLAYINNFAKLPIYDVDFGSEEHPIRPVYVIPHNLPDPVLFWPAPPDQGGIDVYFTGVLARAVKKLDRNDSWWKELRQFHNS